MLSFFSVNCSTWHLYDKHVACILYVSDLTFNLLHLSKYLCKWKWFYMHYTLNCFFLYWCRRQVFWISKQVLQLVMEDAIDDWMIRQIHWVRREDIIAQGIRWVQDVSIEGFNIIIVYVSCLKLSLHFFWKRKKRKFAFLVVIKFKNCSKETYTITIITCLHTKEPTI